MKDDWVPVTRGQFRAYAEEQRKVNQWAFDLIKYYSDCMWWVHGEHHGSKKTRKPEYPSSPWVIPEDDQGNDALFEEHTTKNEENK